MGMFFCNKTRIKMFAWLICTKNVTVFNKLFILSDIVVNGDLVAI